MTMDYWKYNHVRASMAAALSDVLLLLEQIITASGMGCAAIDLVIAFFSTRREHSRGMDNSR